MLLIYATEADLTEWTGETAPDNTTTLLRSASLLVRRYTLTALYAADSDGYPTDPRVREAFTHAVCAQAASWAAAGIDPAAGEAAAAGSTVASKGIGSASLSYAGGSDTAKARARAVRELCQEARTILTTAGLIGGEPLHDW